MVIVWGQLWNGLVLTWTIRGFKHVGHGVVHSRTDMEAQHWPVFL
jgi:hypothetical protein